LIDAFGRPLARIGVRSAATRAATHAETDLVPSRETERVPQAAAVLGERSSPTAPWCPGCHSVDAGVLVQGLLIIVGCGRLEVEHEVLHGSGELVRCLVFVGKVDAEADVDAGVGPDWTVGRPALDRRQPAQTGSERPRFACPGVGGSLLVGVVEILRIG
jgi:hypothetical protein